jgi:maleylacetate reductase
MSDRDGLKPGSYSVTAHERILWGRPAAEAVLEEADRYGANRIFVTSTRSLTEKQDGPLQRLERALGSRHVGTYARIRSHSPREDVVAGAAAARAAKADLLVAVGGGSVIDATKAMQLCLWLSLESVDAMELYCVGFERHKSIALALPPDPIRMLSVSTTLSASEFTENAGITQSRTNTKQSFRHRLFAPRSIVLDPAATLETPDWLLFATGIRSVDHAVENYCNSRASLATEALSLQGLKLLYRALPAIKRDPRAPGGPAWHVAGHCALRLGRADRRQPWHRLRLGCWLRRGARAYLLRHAAGRADLERRRQRGAPEGLSRGDGRARAQRRGADQGIGVEP